MNDILIRKLKAEDAQDISKIYAAITQTAVIDDFIHIITEQVSRKEDASFVAELDGRVVQRPGAGAGRGQVGAAAFDLQPTVGQVLEGLWVDAVLFS